MIRVRTLGILALIALGVGYALGTFAFNYGYENATKEAELRNTELRGAALSDNRMPIIVYDSKTDK